MKYLTLGLLFFIFSSISSESILENMGRKERIKYYSENSIKFESTCVSTKIKNNKVVALKRYEPKYPLLARKQKIEGFVTANFDLQTGLDLGDPKNLHKISMLRMLNKKILDETEASPVNIRIIEHYPNDIFDKSFKDALSKWVYKSSENVTCMRIRIDYVLN